MEDGRPNLAVVNDAFGYNADLYTDVLQVQPNAGAEQIQEAYFDRRNDLFLILADIDNANDDDDDGAVIADSSVTDARRRKAERQMDAVVCAVRILGDPDLRLEYDDLRTERMQGKPSVTVASAARHHHHPASPMSSSSSSNKTDSNYRQEQKLHQATAALQKAAALNNNRRAAAMERNRSVAPHSTSPRQQHPARTATDDDTWNLQQQEPQSRRSETVEPQSSHSSTASDDASSSPWRSMPDLMHSAISTADTSYGSSSRPKQKQPTPAALVFPNVSASSATNIRGRLGLGATIRTRSSDAFFPDEEKGDEPPKETSTKPTRQLSFQLATKTTTKKAMKPATNMLQNQTSSRGRQPTVPVRGKPFQTIDNNKQHTRPPPMRKNSRATSADGSTTLSTGSATFVSDDGDDDDEDDDDEEYTFYTVDDPSVTESVLITHKETKSQGLLDRIRTEILGALDDTTKSFEQVMNVFTLQEEDIVAVMGRIDKAKRQVAKIHILYPNKEEEIVFPSAGRTGRKATSKTVRKA